MEAEIHTLRLVRLLRYVPYSTIFASADYFCCYS